MEYVSFKVAKAIKNAGYPQDRSSNCYNEHTGEFHYTSCSDNWLEIGSYIDAPTYLEVWLWLWREKHIAVEADYSCTNNDWINGCICGEKFNDPEEAIIAAIEHLAENDLIKGISK